MRQTAFVAALAALTVALSACGHRSPSPAAPGPSDANATPETRALFASLYRLSGGKVLFGHHDDLAYGVNWSDEAGRSDVKEVAGSYPAVYEWECSGLEHGQDAGIDKVRFDRIRGFVADNYKHGDVITFSWHMPNPVTGGNAWDTTAAVAAILPGGAQHAEYVLWLDRFAAFIGALQVPVIVRPFHEMNGSWFWWGGRHWTASDYQQLWRFTVDYLRNTKGVHNVLYAYSPDVFDSKDDYLTQYPGDSYVDVIGYDDYKSIKSPDTRDVFVRRLHDIVELAQARGKIPALTETGLEGVPDSTWWTGVLLAGIKSDSLTKRIVYVSLWRNANTHHFYVPYVGQASAGDFVRFRHDPIMAFEGDFPNPYHASGDR